MVSLTSIFEYIFIKIQGIAQIYMFFNCIILIVRSGVEQRVLHMVSEQGSERCKVASASSVNRSDFCTYLWIHHQPRSLLSVQYKIAIIVTVAPWSDFTELSVLKLYFPRRAKPNELMNMNKTCFPDGIGTSHTNRVFILIVAKKVQFHPITAFSNNHMSSLLMYLASPGIHQILLVSLLFEHTVKISVWL